MKQQKQEEQENESQQSNIDEITYTNFDLDFLLIIFHSLLTGFSITTGYHTYTQIILHCVLATGNLGFIGLDYFKGMRESLKYGLIPLFLLSGSIIILNLIKFN